MNITLKKKFVFIDVDLEILQFLKLWGHMCGAILFPNTHSTWRNGKESIRGKKPAYGIYSIRVVFTVIPASARIRAKLVDSRTVLSLYPFVIEPSAT